MTMGKGSFPSDLHADDAGLLIVCSEYSVLTVVIH